MWAKASASWISDHVLKSVVMRMRKLISWATPWWQHPCYGFVPGESARQTRWDGAVAPICLQCCLSRHSGLFCASCRHCCRTVVGHQASQGDSNGSLGVSGCQSEAPVAVSVSHRRLSAQVGYRQSDSSIPLALVQVCSQQRAGITLLLPICFRPGLACLLAGRFKFRRYPVSGLEIHLIWPLQSWAASVRKPVVFRDAHADAVLALVGQQLEGLSISHTVDTKVAAVESEDSPDLFPIGKVHETGIGEVNFLVVIGLKNRFDLNHVLMPSGRRTYMPSRTAWKSLVRSLG